VLAGLGNADHHHHRAGGWPWLRIHPVAGDRVRDDGAPARAHGAALLDRIVNQQAQIIAYTDDYKLMIFATLLALLVLMRRRRAAVAPADAHAAMD